MQAFSITDLSRQHEQTKGHYLEFLRVPALSAGLYLLAAGSVDPQLPHTEDEVYYIVSGRGSIRVGDEDQEVETGSIIFVPARLEHRFHSIKEDLSILVFFAPAEYSQASQEQGKRA